MKRGIVVPLIGSQRVKRLLYLAGKITINELDEFVRKDGAPLYCPDIYYLLKDHNGGKDPTAPDPADRWSKPGSKRVNRTSDCIGGMAWAGGWDRFQKIRFQHFYGGWINTDSMRMDADGPQTCFRRLEGPEEGCYVVYGSDPHKKSHGVPIGHIGGVTKVPANFKFTDRESWKQLEVVDVASRKLLGVPVRANKMTTGLGWYGKDAMFVVPIMQA